MNDLFSWHKCFWRSSPKLAGHVLHIRVVSNPKALVDDFGHLEYGILINATPTILASKIVSNVELAYEEKIHNDTVNAEKALEI